MAMSDDAARPVLSSCLAMGMTDWEWVRGGVHLPVRQGQIAPSLVRGISFSIVALAVECSA